MKWNKFIRLLLEASKDRFIDKTDLSDEEKAYYKDWFNKHSEKHQLVNWQNKAELTKENFDKIIANSKNTLSQTKKAGLGGLEKIGSNAGFDFYKINSYEQARFADSVACCGEGAKWCIGWESSDNYWQDKAVNQGIKFVLAVRKGEAKPNEKKYMIQIGSDRTFKPELKAVVWKQTNNPDEVITGERIKTFFGAGIEKIIPEENLKIQQFKIDKEGNLEIIDKEITSLKRLNLPKEIKGDFNCGNCKKLTSLEGAPQKVGGDFNCSNCPKLKSLEGVPQSIGGKLICDDKLKQKSVKTYFNY